MINKYKTRPCEIEAVQWDGTNVLEIEQFAGQAVQWCHDCVMRYGDQNPYAGYMLYIHTLEGVMRADVGDYIIRGLKGEYYPCKPDVFSKKYEVAK